LRSAGSREGGGTRKERVFVVREGRSDAGSRIIPYELLRPRKDSLSRQLRNQASGDAKKLGKMNLRGLLGAWEGASEKLAWEKGQQGITKSAWKGEEFRNGRARIRGVGR